MGAAAVLIADDICLCNDEVCQAKNPDMKTCEDREPTMADDGSGSDISIPAFLMYKVDSDLIKEELKLGKPVQVEMAWSLPGAGRVRYDLWSVPGDPLSRGFLSSFSPVAQALGDRAHFTPHFYIYDGQKVGCVGGYNHACTTLCTNNGRYCAMDPTPNRSEMGGITGADVVHESLRRLCVWKHYGEDDGIGQVWWNYIRLFQEECEDNGLFSDMDCIHRVLREAGVDHHAMGHCIRHSGGLEDDSPNALLELEISTRQETGVLIFPTARVNDMDIRGSLTPQNVFEAICSGYARDYVPEICHNCARCPRVMECVRQRGVCSGEVFVIVDDEQAAVSTSFFLFCVFFVVFGFLGAGLWHYKRTRDEMQSHVRDILAEYMPLEDQEQMQPQQSGVL
mmetsp:Transcript_26464/g.61585  ORF Transcript_26464/g.61585 Transcript_26464/m.61585 type:complete len:395 (+) Transcript_26464:2-1186(+)